MNQHKHIIKEYEDKKVVDTFDSERSRYAYQRYKHKKESAVLRRVLKSCEMDQLKVLDVAVGTGRMIDTVFNSGKIVDYHGVDTSQEMLDNINVQEKSDIWFQNVAGITLKQGDATKLPYADNTFDVVFTFHLLWHLPQEVQIEIIKEMKRVCKPEGFTLMDLINEDFVWGNDTEGIYKWKEIYAFAAVKRIDKLNDFPLKNSLIYSVANIMNYFERILPINLFHMIYLTIQK